MDMMNFDIPSSQNLFDAHDAYEEQVNGLFNFANTIKCVIQERDKLKRENEELKAELEKYHEYLEASYKSSQETAGAWIGAVLRGDIQINPKQTQSNTDN